MWFKQAGIVIITGVLLLTYVLVFEPQNVFNLPPGKSGHLAGNVRFLSNFLSLRPGSGIPEFLFMRYQKLFQQKWLLVLASGISFSFVYILYFSALSLVLTFFAGIYLAWLYDKTKSVMLTSIIHGVLGFLIFSIGLGQHFWLDIMQWL